MSKRSITDDNNNNEIFKQPRKKTKTNPEKMRDFKFNHLNELKRLTIIACFQRIRKNSKYKVEVIKDIDKINPALKQIIENHSRYSGEDLNKLDVKFLSEPSDNYFMKGQTKQLNSMMDHTGITNDLSTDKINHYRMCIPEKVKYQTHKPLLTTPIIPLGEQACMHKDLRSSESYCKAQRDFGLTLKATPHTIIVPEHYYNKEKNKNDIKLVERSGMCLYCERWTTNYVFKMFRKRNLSTRLILNRVRYLVDTPNQYSSKYCIGQNRKDKFFGVHGFYPKFKKKAYKICIFQRTINGITYKVKGLIEKEDCFFRKDTAV